MHNGAKLLFLDHNSSRARYFEPLMVAGYNVDGIKDIGDVTYASSKKRIYEYDLLIAHPKGTDMDGLPKLLSALFQNISKPRIDILYITNWYHELDEEGHDFEPEMKDSEIGLCFSKSIGVYYFSSGSPKIDAFLKAVDNLLDKRYV